MAKKIKLSIADKFGSDYFDKKGNPVCPVAHMICAAMHVEKRIRFDKTAWGIWELEEKLANQIAAAGGYNSEDVLGDINRLVFEVDELSSEGNLDFLDLVQGMNKDFLQKYEKSFEIVKPQALIAAATTLSTRKKKKKSWRKRSSGSKSA